MARVVSAPSTCDYQPFAICTFNTSLVKITQRFNSGDMDKLHFVHAVPMKLQATLKVEASYFSSPVVPIYSSLK